MKNKQDSKKDKNFNRVVKNISYTILNQVITSILGLIVPRLFILNFGSDINGFVSFVSQIFVYFNLLEAGLSTAMIQALYKSIANDDKEEISGVMAASKIFYTKVARNYMIGVVLFATIYPFITTSTIDKGLIAYYIFMQGSAGAIQFFFRAPQKNFMMAEGRSYVISNINLFVNIATQTVKIVFIYLGANLAMIQTAFFVVSMLQTFIYGYYYKKHFGWVNTAAKPLNDSLKNKNSAFIHQISGMVFNSTDVVILSLFTNFKIVSIYAVYNLVINALNSFLSSINGSLIYILGQTFHKSKKRYIELFDTYNLYYMCLIFSIMSVCYVLLGPFIALYTRNSDINYVIKYLPLLFCSIQIVSSTRMVSATCVSVAGHFKETIPYTLIETGINLAVSIILVFYIGIYGVLIGTLVALLYRANNLVIYSNRVILNRSPKKTYWQMFCSFSLFSIIFLVNLYYPITIRSYLDFFIKGFLAIIVILPFYMISLSLLNRKEFSFIYNIVNKGFLMKLRKAKK